MNVSQMCQNPSLEVKSITVATPACVMWAMSAFSSHLFHSPAHLELFISDKIFQKSFSRLELNQTISQQQM